MRITASKLPDEPTVSSLSVRRERIVAALRHLMMKRGFAETTISDLATAAGMSVSHLLYYYPSKDAVLEELCEQFVKQSYRIVLQDALESPTKRIRVLAQNLFHGGAIPREHFSILRELNALSAHRPKIRAWLRQFNAWMMAYLIDLFSQTPRRPGMSAHRAAEIAAAVWTGLVTNIDFDDALSDSLARDLFRQTFSSLANISGGRSRAFEKGPARGA